MPIKEQVHLLYRKVASWSVLLAGVAIGIASQRIPEIKSHTDPYLQTIESSPLFLKMKASINTTQTPGEIVDRDLSYTHYKQHFPPAGGPASSFIINRPGYTLAYDARTRNPAWVYEHLTADNLKGEVDRSSYSFKEDEAIPKHLRASLTDYKGQGLDHGHMAPAADHAANPEAMGDTFYLTNICPQCPQLNRDFWAKFERHARDLTQQYPHVYVITGPLYLSYQEGKRRFVKYQVIGSNEIAVPSHFFKVLMLEDTEGQREVRAYILPNTVVPLDTPLEQFRTTAHKVEKAAGILLLNDPR